MNLDEKTKKSWSVLIWMGWGTATLLIVGLITLYSIINTIVGGIIYDNKIGIAQRDKQLYANEIDDWFSSAYSTVRTLANTLSALSYPQEHRGPGFREYDDRDRDFIKIAENIVRENDYIINVFIGFADGSIINGGGMRPSPEWSPLRAPWFNAAVEAGEGNIVITNPYWSNGNQNFTAGIATWLPDLNNVGAVVGISVSQDDILNRIAHDPVLGDGYRILVARGGSIIFHTKAAIADDESIVTIYDIPDGEFFVDSIRGSARVVSFDDYSMGPSYLVSARLNTVNWTLFDVIPATAVESPISQHIRTILLPVGILFAAMYAFAIFLFYAIAKNREEKIALEKDVANANSKAKSRFLARMSHELRTPITAVMGISEIQLQSSNLPPAIEASFAEIYNSSQFLLSIMNDILDFSKIEAGKLTLVKDEYEVKSVINDVAHLQTVYSDSKDIKFLMSIDENLPTHLVGDAMRIEQIISNLLSNAFKYTDAGTVEFSLKSEKSKTNHDILTLIITIRDTGLGMTTGQLRDLFAEYARFHEKETKYIVGAGLGMPIVYNLVQLMHAKIEINSEVGKGTTVVVYIPQKITNNEVIGKEEAARLQQFESGHRSKRLAFTPEAMPNGSVLVVDDIETNLYVAKGLLELYGIKTKTCTSGQEAIELIKQGNIFDIVFMDEMMPVMSGTETMNALRQMGYKQPIVALTANAMIDQAEEFIRNGFDGFISKPIQSKQLNAILQKYVRDK